MLAHLPIVILASLLPMPVADAMPKLDIARECQFEGGIKPTQERCAADEAQARNELQNEWKQFGADAIKRCNEESTTDNIASYVELLTCLEMERDVKNPADAMGAMGKEPAQAAANVNRRHPRTRAPQ